MPGRFSSLANDTPDIDHQPGAPALVAEPVDRQIHADLADAAERREHELALRRGHDLTTLAQRLSARTRRPPRRVRIVAVGAAQHQPAGVVDALETARALAIG